MSAPYRYQRPAPTPFMITAPLPVSSDVAKRIYLVRLACGNGVDRPLSMDAFAARLTVRTGRQYNRGMIARFETGKQAAQLVDVECIASVDPRHRGKAWLGFGDDAVESVRRTRAIAHLRRAQEILALDHRRHDANLASDMVVWHDLGAMGACVEFALRELCENDHRDGGLGK